MGYTVKAPGTEPVDASPVAWKLGVNVPQLATATQQQQQQQQQQQAVHQTGQLLAQHGCGDLNPDRPIAASTGGLCDPCCLRQEGKCAASGMLA